MYWITWHGEQWNVLLLKAEHTVKCCAEMEFKLIYKILAELFDFL